MKRFQLLILCSALATAISARAAGDSKTPPETEPGIPVTDQLTKDKCGTCHKADENSNLTRISWVRTTPEGWEEAIKRMVRLNGLTLQPAEARHILNYLATDHGLAPEEAAPSRWYLEMRQIEAEATPNPQVRIACASCHPLARPQTWHRSPTEWKLLVNMHLGYFPVSEHNSFHARPRPDGYGVLPASLNSARGAKDPVDEALDFLNKTQVLHTAAWSNWRASMRNPNLKGKWAVNASSPGKGRYFGVMEITPGADPDTFKTQTTLTRVSDGSTVTFSGASAVYTGYEWRGRAQASDIGPIRQVMTIAPDQSKIEGRWFWGGYQEFEFNVSARRAATDTLVLGTNISSIRAGSQNVPVKILGENFPKNLTASDIDMGAGISVSKVVSVKPSEITLNVSADPKITSGMRSVSVKSTIATDAFAVYDKIDYIKVAMPSALAHLGGGTHPKGYVQFEAHAYNRGIDGKANTADDIDLGPVTAKWSMEEFIARYNDDDKEFVGSINNDGLFTPAGEGPNQQRRFSTNNTGDVWVVAKYTDKDTGPTPLAAKSYLAVTVPIYMKWDEPEVAQ
jgi:quinohemoprotein amine dehydrogenase